MRIERVDSPNKQITFKYKNILKTLYKKGKLPDVKYDISGRELTVDNATLDHIIPKSQGGKNHISNYMIATKEFNQLRGCRPITDFITPQGLERYIEPFLGVKVDGFDGNLYVKWILQTIEKVRKKLSKKNYKRRGE